MRDEPFPHPAFHITADDEPYDELAFAGDQPAVAARRPPALSQTGRVIAIGAVLACMLGAAIGLSSPKAFRGAPDTETVKARAAASAAELSFRPIGGRYQPPNRERIAAAYADAGRLVGSEGVSGAARASMECFQKLSRDPDYGLMDYCLALDAYGALAYERAAGGAAPPSTYFGQGPVRRQQAVQQLTAGKTDPNSRLLDTNRLIQAVAVTVQPPAAPPAPPVAVAAAAAPATAPAPAPETQTRAPAPVVVAQAPERPEPVRPRVYRSEPVQAPRPQAEPSFDCRSARTRGERMICSEPALAAADRRMNTAFQRALESAPNPRALMADQNRWLALRDEIAPDYEGVMGLYQDRIAELRRRDY